MSEPTNSAFGKFIPGFDFLQNLAKGASQALPQMPNLSNWVAPTLNVEELEKRIGELKAVRFWLDQNATALAATIQALEVQKMTLATLKGMNFSMSDLADALKLKEPVKPVGAKPVEPARRPAAPKQPAAHAGNSGPEPTTGKPEGANARVVDPLQWWGALTQQFQQIATDALENAAATTTAMSSGAGSAHRGAPARGRTARKSSARSKRSAVKTTAR